MVPDDIPDDVVRFLDACIDSVEQLRVLLLLHSNPERTWTIEELTVELRSVESSITKRLNDLYNRKIIARDPDLTGKHRFIPSTPEASALVKRLAEQNQIRPYGVMEAIYSRPAKGLHDFADAFNFRGNKS